MDERDYKSLIHYYGREKFYQSMQNCALEAMTKFPGDHDFRLYNGIALVLGNRVQEGMRELNPLQGEKNLAMATIIALMYAHKRCTVIDKEALINLDGRLKEERKRLNGSGAYYAAVFLFYSGKIDKAREYAEKSLKSNPEFYDAMVLKGWADLMSPTRIGRNALSYFEKAMANTRSIDAHLGEVKYHQYNNDFENAIAVLNKLSVKHPELNVSLIEKMKCQLAHWNWDHALETANRILHHESTNIEALRIKIIVDICRDGNYTGSVFTLQQLYRCVEKFESSNSELFWSIGQLFSRVCGRNTAILEETFRFVDRAHVLSPGNSDFITELGYHSIYLGRIKEATKYFRSATKLDDSSIYALCGLTLCQMIESGCTEQVVQQIEFLVEIQSENKIPLLMYMSSKLAAQDADKAIALLTESCEIQFRNLQTLSYGAEYLRKFDPDFLLQVTNQLMNFAPVQPNSDMNTLVKEHLHISLKHSLNILEAIVKACPGLIKGVYQLARTQFLCGDLGTATVTLQRILQDLDPTFTPAHLLVAQIHIYSKNFLRASQSLEICLSHDFQVREHPIYHLLSGIISKHNENYDHSIKSFLAAVNLTTTGTEEVHRKSNSPSKRSAVIKDSESLSLADKVTLYLELIDTYTILEDAPEALKWMQSAIGEFSSTSESGRLTIANANLMLQHSNVPKCLELLGSIKSDAPYYLQAKTRMANVYLRNKKDRLAFAQCFKELVENCPGAESYLMMGDAYMSIQEPDLAIDAYRQALKQRPHDPLLASKLGRAYVKTHQYAKAISYYKEATSSSENVALKLDLAELYLKLRQFSNAEQTLVDEIEVSKTESEDIAVLHTRTKQLLLLARVREKSGHIGASLSTLKEARDNQYRIHRRIQIEQSGSIEEQFRLLSKICVLMAEQSVSLRDNEQAIQHYKEALKNTPDDMIILAALARMYMQVNDMEQCQHTCNSILQIDANNEAASVMMADLSFRRMDFDNAAYHFSQLLLSQPMYWTALARLIEVMRRSSTLTEATPFIQRAENMTTQPQQEAGLNYCKGLFEWYTGNPNGALRYFNNSRRDTEWGQQSIFNMIDICLNPDGDLPSELMGDSMDESEHRDSRGMALKTAERLLKELKPRPGGMDNEALNHRLLENFLLLASKDRHNIEKALQDLTAIASHDAYKDHVGPILGISTAYIMLKQHQRAKNQLKRLAKTQWTFEDAEYLERCWLLLADIYIQASKYEIASELLARVLEHNKSCAKAYEFCGYISEKEQSYRSAAIHYNSAWRYSGRSKPTIGYKLAFNHMKTKQYADAIDVCQQVLKLHPEYPSIKKDILDKCRNNLKS